MGSARPAVRVLFVEDSSTAAEMVRRLLARAPWPELVIRHAFDLDEVEPLLAERWDVVLLDLGLPGCHDLEAIAWIRARCPELPIVVLTAQDDLDLAVRALEAEAQDCLVKRAIDSETLMRAIRYAIGRQHILRRLARAVEDAKNSEARVRELMARSSDGIVVGVGPEKRVVFANPAAQQLLGRAEPQLLGESLTRLDLDPSQLRTEIARPPRVIDVRTVDVEWEGVPARMALLRDVTEQRRSDELRVQLERAERLAAVGRLATGIAHEINNPLTYVRMNLEVAMRRVSSSAAAHDVEFLLTRFAEMQEGIDRVVNIVRDLRAFARVDPDDRAQPVDVRAAIESALKMAEPHLKHRARVERRMGAVPYVLAADGRLSQVFLNLLINSAQAIDEGRVAENEILVRAFAEGDRVIVEVKDTGRGIAPEHLARVFEPFFSTTKGGDGLGLGLSICRNLVESYAGSLEIDSVLGRGTLVRVILPAATESPLAPPLRSSAPSAPRSRILVVDDEPAILRALVQLLGEQHDVASALSGDAARAWLEEGEPVDVIFCDLVMDSGTGMELYKWLGARRPELLARVVFMSGGGTTPEAERFLAAHAGRTLRKPLTAEMLVAKIHEVTSAR